jgi:hypothetical protein
MKVLSGASPGMKKPGCLNWCVLSRQPGMDRNSQRPKDLVRLNG